MSPERRASSPLSRLRFYTLQADMVRPRKYKLRKTPKMELYRRRAPDYTELAYREAVAKLKYLLAESYTPVTSQKPTTSFAPAEKEVPASETAVYPLEYPRPRLGDLSPFHRRQDEYIEQLEKEGQLYREELSRILDKVRDVVDKPHGSEEEESDKEVKATSRRGRGPSIVYSSRISELEAQLTQCRLELRKAQDEASYLKAHSKPIQPPVSQQAVQQLETLQRERDDLNERVASLQALVGQLREKEASATQKVKRSLDVVDQAQFDKNQVVITLEMEVRRLKAELERMSDKQREALQESARRVSEAERRYAMQIERLNGDLAAQWDAANRLNLELDRARRTEVELRRELAQKNATIEELKKELTTKTGSLQNEALTATAERENLEGELSACKLAVERAERQGRQEAARMQAEIQALRARLDRADQDLLHSRKENIRLADVIAGLEKELSLAKLTKDSASSKESKKADELASMIKEMDAKHEGSVSELEGLIQSQTQLMEKLNAECQALTKRLEESSARHKEEMASLQSNIEYLSSKLEAPDHFRNQEWRDDGKLGIYKDKSVLPQKKLPTEEEKAIYNKEGILESHDKVGNDVNVQKQDLSKHPQSEQQKTVEDSIHNQTSDKMYPSNSNEGHVQESYKHSEILYEDQQPYKKGEEFEQNQSYDSGQPGNYEEKSEYNTVVPEIYKPDQAYDQGRTEEYDQNQIYDQTRTGEYEQSQAYAPSRPGEYEQSQAYDPSRPGEYDQSQVYDPTRMGEYEQNQVYDQEGRAQYQENPVYEQEGTGQYDQNQAYDQTVKYSNDQIYEGDPAYSHEGAVYGQNQTYNQDGEYQQQGYDQEIAYDQSNIDYSQGYDPSSAQYEQGGTYPQPEGYEQGDVQTGERDIYQSEQQGESTTSQAYQEEVFEQENLKNKTGST